MLKADAESHHEEDEHIAMQVEEGKELFFALGEREYAGCIALDEVVEHQRKTNGYGHCDEAKPPHPFGMRGMGLKEGLYAGDENLDAGSQPTKHLHE